MQLSGVWRRIRRQEVVVAAIVLVMLALPTTTGQDVMCYWCEGCDVYVESQTEKCPAQCAIWYSKSGVTTTVSRGCAQSALEDDIIYEQCETELCNTASIVRCVHCSSTESAECADVICPASDDLCYVNPTDGKRGCTSDPEYVADCSEGSCTVCSSTEGQACNNVPKCFVCNTSQYPDCLLDSFFIQRCPKATDQCYRFRDEEQALHLGCTSEEDYTVNCEEGANCQTCTGDECNRDENFSCYTCDDCSSVDGFLDNKVECNLFEQKQCYTGYDWTTKQTHRGCYSEGLRQYDSFDLCTADTCNDQNFPNHLQCYQCDGCDIISEADVNYCRNVAATGCFMLLVEFESGTKTLLRGCNTDPAFADCRLARNCETCEGDRCNRAPQTSTRFCDRCEGVEECEMQMLATSCQNTAFTNQCYLYSDGELKKGCLLDLDPALAEACYDPADKRCTVCKDFQCNRQHCVRCDTRVDGVACLLGDKSAPGLPYALCTGNCRMEIDADGHTVRGCAEDFLQPCEQSAPCVESVQAGSNGGIFPENRRQCYKCEGDRCRPAQNPEDGRYCELYRGPDDGCYTYNDGVEIVRGCTTDPDARCVGIEDPYCSISFEDLKNDAAQEQTPLACYQDCPPNGEVASCQSVTCPSPTDRCFVSVSNSGDITRGCTSASCPPDSRDCYKCNEPNCNGLYSVCSTCDTSIDEDCTVGTEHGDVCDLTFRGCFQYQNDDKAIFGCAEQAPDFCLNDANHCAFCEDTFCNAKALSLCYSCTDCQDVASPIMQTTKLCTTDGDSCITGYRDGSIDRDCLSEMPHPFEEYIVIENCAEPNCNRLPVTDWTSCYDCTDCNEVSEGSETHLCLNPSTNECYTRRDFTGAIVRGCLTEATLGECDDGFNCDACSGENCNDVAVPREFSCVQCDSSTMADCANYNVLRDCSNPFGLLFDSCVTYTNASSVLKGCLSSAELIGCLDNSDSRCLVSPESMGNARPVQCVECQASEECIAGNYNELPVVSEVHGSCVSFLDGDGAIVRGNIVHHPNYQESSEYLECFSDGCNVGVFPADRLLCYQCSGEECARLPLLTAAITPQPCLQYDKTNARCYTWYESASSAMRGCLLDDDSLCRAEGVACLSCTGNGCNQLDYSSFIETKACVKCTTNRGCEQSASEEQCTNGDGCYTFFSGLLVVAKGCVSELTASMEWYEECAVGGDRCERCYGDYCNRNKCYTCSSEFGSAASCIEPRRGVTESSTCAVADECVAFIDANGHTVRGCSDSFVDPISECSEEGDTCQRCSSDHCNNKVLPKDRIKCYQCSGTAADCLEPPRNSASYCDVYLEGEESCYTYFQDELTVERGCTAQRSAACEQHCQTCNTAACNDQIAYRKNTLSCAQCTDAECPAVDATVRADVKPCTVDMLFGRTDQCYTYIYPDGTTRRGCLSDLEKSESTTASKCLDETDGRCKLCPDTGCNERSVNCFVCNTDINPDCADRLDESTNKAYLQACGTGQCVSLLDGSTTWKGCYEDFKVLCESGEACQIAEGPKSNSAIYPADRITCYQCKGSGCDEVQRDSTKLSTCQQFDPDDECYTYVSDDGETFRGCTSDARTLNPCTEHPEVCFKCASESGCNTEPARRSNELTCAQCFSAFECETVERFEQCTKPVLLGRYDACYVQSFAGEILARGCLSDAATTLHDKCTSGANSECSLCQCDRCNGPPVECVSCEGEFGCGEVLGVSSLVQCTTGSCVSFVKDLPSGATVIAKGCSENYEQDTCGKGPAANGEASYQLCNSSGCNDILFPVDRLKCFQCKDDACSDPSLEPMICEPYTKNDKCYSFLDRQQKGCIGQLADTMQCNPEDGTCVVCDESDGCNEEPRALDCIDCSSRNDPSCVGPSAIMSNRKVCPVGGCVTLIDENGFTVRGCAKDYASCVGTTTCQVCTNDDACNDAPFPSDRLQCYQCSGADCLDVAGQAPSFCQLYSTNDACYVYASSSNNVHRGCTSDPDRECPTGGECVTCSNRDGCNSDPPTIANTLTCHHCEGADCAGEQTGAGTGCPGTLLLGRSDACYTWVERYTVRRGCLSEDDACSPSNPNCHVCTGGKDCNTAPYPVELHGCLQCGETDANERCAWGFNRTQAQQCPPATLQSAEVLGCYSCYIPNAVDTANKRELFHRGCAGDERQAQCQPDTIQVCLGEGCNNRNERLQICAKCYGDGCTERWDVVECRGIVPYERRGCYLTIDQFKKQVESRGCAAELDDSTWQLCGSRDSGCITCYGNECNYAARGVGSVILVVTLVIAVLLSL